MDPRIPDLIRPLMESYVGQINEQFPGVVCSVYLVGSIALGEFNENFSDIDFVTVLNRVLIPVEVEQLHSIHHLLEKRFPRWKMSGSYIQSHDLGALDEDMQPHPHYHDGILHPNANHELNTVTWWELKNHAIVVTGVPVQDLHFSIDWTLLIRDMMENLNTYWATWASQPSKIIILLSDWGIQWAVTGVLRQFYTLKENSITTKIKAAQYGLGCLPLRWHRIIQEAIAIRKGGTRSAAWFRIARMLEAVRFLKFVIQTCNFIYTRR